VFTHLVEAGFMTSRERILDGAAFVMRDRGLARATTKEIARAAGVSEALLYKVFQDKTDIFLAVFSERLPRVGVLSEGLATGAGRGSLKSNLRQLVAELLSFYLESFPIAASVFSDPDLLERHRETLRERDAGPARMVQGVAAYLRAEQTEGRIGSSVRPAVVAELLVGACLHRAFLLSFQQQKPAATTVRRFAADIASTLTPILL